MQESKLYLEIYKFKILVICDSAEVVTKLKNDFSYFLKQNLVSVDLEVSVEKVEHYNDVLPVNTRASKQSQNSITYDVGNIRYNDFYGKGVSVFNYKDEKAVVKYIDASFLHEMLYLLILSRTTKSMDKRGLHKIHACGVNLNNQNAVLMMPSKGGKTTSFIELIKDQGINIISDDTPVIDSKGNIHPFPLRLGVEDSNVLRANFPYIDEIDLYEFDRQHFSKKTLIATNKLKNKIKTSEKNILICGFRSTYKTPKTIKISKFKMYKELINHMIIGVGLPMVIEYFLENSTKDFFNNIKILITRNISAVRLLLKSDCYFLYTSSDIKLNVNEIKKLLNEG